MEEKECELSYFIFGILIGLLVLMLFISKGGECFSSGSIKSDKKISFKHNGIFMPDTVKTFRKGL